MTDAASPPISVDLCIVGAGSGGLSLAAAAAAFGVSVALIEKGEMGGDCLNVGCVPSKALIAAARRAEDVRGAHVFGLDARIAPPDQKRVRHHVKDVIAQIAPNDSQARFEAMGVRVIRAPARFLDARTLEAGGVRVTARRFVLATGSRPAIPPIPGLTDVPCFTNETIFDLDETPERLVVVGAGAVGLELAQAFRRLGADVTVLEARTALSQEDSEMVGVALDALARDGVVVREQVKIESIAGAAGAIAVMLEGGEKIEGTHLLVATGRKPAIEGLGLDAAGVAVTDAGVTVDKGLRTTNRRIFAIGDCAASQPRFTHAANHHAGLVIRSALFRLPVKADPLAIPRVVFTDPEIASCGLSETEARASRSDVVTWRWPFSENDRARAERSLDGHIKVIATKKGQILGVSIVGRHAGELLPMWSLAISRKLKLRDVAGVAFAYPTLSEVSRRAAIGSFASLTQSPLVRRAIAFLRRFG
jgi:pyruvate/2-oxoglutarate dehydrogenase complex dihydrolipoamide dehydrogenase (E3) component